MNSREITLHEICQAYHKQHSCGSFLEQTVDNKHFPPAKLLQKEGTLMLKYLVLASDPNNLFRLMGTTEASFMV
jgi:hypothetical protein